MRNYLRAILVVLISVIYFIDSSFASEIQRDYEKSGIKEANNLIDKLKDADSFLLNNNVLIDKEVDSPSLLSGIGLYDASSFNIISHGRPGQLLINGKWLNAIEIVDFLKRNKLLESGNYQILNIYGCEFAKGDLGMSAVLYLKKSLGVSIAASDDVTGVDGDWDLEVGHVVSTNLNINYQYNLQTSYNYSNTTTGAINSSTTSSTPLVRTFNVTDDFNIVDLNVRFVASHTFRGDIEATLTSPSGTVVTVVSPTGNFPDNYDILLDNDTGGAFDDGNDDNTADPVDRTVLVANLSNFEGQDAIGTWTLKIWDNYGPLDNGTYIKSILEFQGTANVDPCDPVSSGNLDSDGDGITDICDIDDDNDGI